MIMGPLVLIVHCKPLGLVAIRPSGIIIHNVITQSDPFSHDQVSQPFIGLGHWLIGKVELVMLMVGPNQTVQ